MLIEIVKHSGMIVISEIVGNYLFTRKYLGYSKREAISLFREEVKREKNKKG